MRINDNYSLLPQLTICNTHSYAYKYFDLKIKHSYIARDIIKTTYDMSWLKLTNNIWVALFPLLRERFILNSNDLKKIQINKKYFLFIVCFLIKSAGKYMYQSQSRDIGQSILFLGK